MKRSLICCCVMLAMSFLTVSAQNVPKSSMGQECFAGISGDIPFGLDTFSSFGSDKTRAGWGVGVYGGRRFGNVVSAEIALTAGRINLSARECCVERGYWLGSDGIRYEAPVVDILGWNYSELKSSVSLARMDARVNVNVLGFFSGTKDGPWAVELSPALSAVFSKAEIGVIATGENVAKKDPCWNLGAGGRVQVRRSLGGNLEVSAYSGLTCLAGKRFDAMPEHQHNRGLLWENGIRFGVRFGTGRQTGRSVVTE